MNKDRRVSLRNAADHIRLAKELVDMVKDQEDFSYSNLPEGIIDSERGEKMERAIDLLDEASEDLDSALSKIDEAKE